VPKTKRVTQSTIVRKAGRVARERAQQQARGVPWRVLLAFRNQYLESESFVFWIRSIEESAGRLPQSVWHAIQEEYPVFLDDELEDPGTGIGGRVWKRLEAWIFDNVFAEVRREGWMQAVVHYAVLDRRYLRSEAYWLKCIAEWKHKKRSSYPSFERWRRSAFRSSELAVVKSRLRRILLPANHVDADYFSDVVESWVGWDEFASWARPALEQPSAIPQSVRNELRRRCPGFLEFDSAERQTQPAIRCTSSLRLADWISTRFFSRPKREGWLSVVRYYAEHHPHWTRAMDYSRHWEADWHAGHIKKYPSFPQWRRDVDNSVEG